MQPEHFYNIHFNFLNKWIKLNIKNILRHLALLPVEEVFVCHNANTWHALEIFQTFRLIRICKMFLSASFGLAHNISIFSIDTRVANF